MIRLTNKPPLNTIPRKTGTTGLGIAYSDVPQTYAWLQPTGWTSSGTTWADSSGNNLTFTASAALTNFGNLNGYQTASLAGNKYLINTALSLPFSSGVTTVIVTQYPSSLGAYCRLAVYATNPFSGDDYNSTSGHVALAHNATNLQVASEYMGPFYSAVTLPASNQWVILVNQSNSTTQTNTWYAAGNTSGTATTTVSGPSFTAGQLVLGSGLGAGAATPWTGPVAEALVFNSFLSSTNLASVVSYLRSKYALT